MGRSAPEKRGGWSVGHSDPETSGGPISKNFFWPFGPQFGLKMRGGDGPHGLFLWIRYCNESLNSKYSLRDYDVEMT